MITRTVLAVAMAASVAIDISDAQAASGVYSFTSAPTASDRQLSLGFVFTTNSAVQVTQLGYYDDGGDGFLTPHTVGIFDSVGNLLTSVTLAAGTTDPLVGDFRYEAVAPITLAAGQTYTAAATTEGPSDPWAYGGPAQLTGFVVNPAITIPNDAAKFVYQSDNVLRDPTDHFSNYQVYAGPNFVISSVPEPATWFLLIGGLGFVGARLRRRGSTAAFA